MKKLYNLSLFVLSIFLFLGCVKGIEDESETTPLPSPALTDQQLGRISEILCDNPGISVDEATQNAESLLRSWT